MINKHKLACCITKKEGKKVSVSVAQVSEVLKLALHALSKEKPSEVLKLLGH